MSDSRTQHYIDPATKQRKPIKVRSIKSRFQRGKGGALAIPKPGAPPELPPETPDDPLMALDDTQD
jgi:hypothetical protein